MPNYSNNMGATGGEDYDNYYYGTSDTGGGAGHVHGVLGSVSSTTISPAYVDIIICSKS
jgi:hypothetical protein